MNNTEIACPVCTMNDFAVGKGIYVCSTCGHEWAMASATENAESKDETLVVKDANGNLLANGDSVVLIKELKLKGSSSSLKGGTKIKGIKLVAGDHELDCKVDGISMMLKACFVRKA